MADYSIKADVKADVSGFKAGIKSAQKSASDLSSTVNSLAKSMTKAFTMVGATIGVKAIVDFGKKSVQSATEAIKQFNLLDQTLRSTGADAWTTTKDLEAMSKELSDSTNYSVTEIQEMQTVLLGFKNITGDAFEDTSEAILDMATVMGMDLKSATQAVGKALDDPIKGINSLSRQGFNFTEEQKAQFEQLIKNGNQLEAQKIILNELATTYGGASKAGQDSFARQRHAIENFTDTLGSKLIPITKVFADNNAKVFNELEKIVSNIDVTSLVNIFTHLSNKTADIFNFIKQGIGNAVESIKSFLNKIDFKPFLQVLDSLFGAVSVLVNKMREINSSNFSILEKIGNELSSLFNQDMINKVAEVIDLIISAVVSLWESISDICGQIKEIIFNTVVNIWNNIKDLFTKSNEALAQSGEGLASWSDVFYNILDNIYRTAQDLINGISAILKGDWAVAWEYAKLAVLRVCNVILDNISTIANAFPSLMNTIINSVNTVIKGINTIRGWLGQAPLELMEEFKSVDLAKSTGLEQKIKDTENKITELTGKSADVGIKNLKRLSSQFSGFTQILLGDIQGLSDGTGEVVEEQKKSYARLLPAVETTYKAVSEWEEKLLNQRLDDLKEYQEEYHDIQVKLIESERQKAIDADTTGANLAKINQYYDNEILKESKRAQKARKDYALKTVTDIKNKVKSFASEIGKIFVGITDSLKGALTGIVNFTKGAFTGAKNIFSKLIDFNPDETLDNLLVIEDKILTFFVETLPRMPSFFASAFNSVVVLVNSLINSIQWNKISGIIENIINTLSNAVPSIMSNIASMTGNLFSTMSGVMARNAPKIISTVKSAFTSIIKIIPTMSKKLINSVSKIVKSVGTYLKNNTVSLVTSFKTWINTSLTGLNTWLTSGGLKTILEAVNNIFASLLQFVITGIHGIVNAIIAMIPDIANGLASAFKNALKAVITSVADIARLMGALANGILTFMQSDDFIQGLTEGVVQLIEVIFTDIIPSLIVMIPNLIGTILTITLKSIPKLISGIITGLINGLIHTDWVKLVKDTFTGFVNAIKNFFGIHSPSTLFQSFGEFMIQGLWNGMSGLGSWLIDNTTSLFSKMLNGIKNVFSGVGDWFGNVFGSIWEGIKNGGSNAITALANTASSVGATVKTGISNAVSTASSVASTVGNAVSNIASGIGNALKKLKFWATGTNNAPSGLAIVGEQGPELVRFRGGERVYNNRNTKDLLSNTGKNDNTFNVTFNNVKDTSAYTLIQQLKRYNREMAINGVI